MGSSVATISLMRAMMEASLSPEVTKAATSPDVGLTNL